MRKDLHDGVETAAQGAAFWPVALVHLLVQANWDNRRQYLVIGTPACNAFVLVAR